MGRIRREIQVDGSRFWALFDSGSRNNYVTPVVAAALAPAKSVAPRTVNIGGSPHHVAQACVLVADVEGHDIDVDAYVIDELGSDEGGRPIEVLLGALAMQKWGIRLVMEEERIDWTHYSKDFLEF